MSRELVCRSRSERVIFDNKSLPNFLNGRISWEEFCRKRKREQHGHEEIENQQKINDNVMKYRSTPVTLQKSSQLQQECRIFFPLCKENWEIVTRERFEKVAYRKKNRNKNCNARRILTSYPERVLCNTFLYITCK